MNTEAKWRCGPTHVNGHRIDYFGINQEMLPQVKACTCAKNLAKRLRISAQHGDRIPILIRIEIQLWPRRQKSAASRRLWNWLKITMDRSSPECRGKFLDSANCALRDAAEE